MLYPSFSQQSINTANKNHASNPITIRNFVFYYWKSLVSHLVLLVSIQWESGHIMNMVSRIIFRPGTGCCCVKLFIVFAVIGVVLGSEHSTSSYQNSPHSPPLVVTLPPASNLERSSPNSHGDSSSGGRLLSVFQNLHDVSYKIADFNYWWHAFHRAKKIQCIRRELKFFCWITGHDFVPGDTSALGDHGDGTAGGEHGHGDEHQGLHISTVDFARVETPFIIALWIFCASLAKIGNWLN